MDFELSVLDFIQSHFQSVFLDVWMPKITALGNAGILWIVLTLVLLLIPKTRKVGAVMAVSLIVEAVCCNLILKPLVERPRPFDANTMVQLLIDRPSDFSFPSGHTGASFAAASALYFSRNRLWIPALTVAILIGFSRLYLYVHYPSDVLAGALLGVLSGWAAYRLVKRDKRRTKEKELD